MPQLAAGIGALVGSIGSAVSGAVAGLSFGSIAGRLLMSVAVSALSRALAPKPKMPGIRIDTTLTGGTQPESFILGRYATGGVAVGPEMAYGDPASGVPNNWLVQVIDLGGIAGGEGLLRIFVDGEEIELSDVEDILPAVTEMAGEPPVETVIEPPVSRGFKALGKYAGHLIVKFRDGTATEVDPYLHRVFKDYPDRPWTADMIGRGRPHAILSFAYNRQLYGARPQLRFEQGGIPLYDPRFDSTAGGSGPQRWNDPATWVPAHNTAVQAYNILRGLSLEGGFRWGGQAEAEDLPYAVFAAAMNRADTAVDLAEGGTEPRFRSGLEVLVADEPASVLEELLKAANGDLAEVGGGWRIRLGEPDGPVHFFADADVMVSNPQELDPFPGLDQTHNALITTWPDPDSLWEPREAPPIYNGDWEEADGDRRLTADLELTACPYGHQVQRVGRAFIQDERRFASHVLTLGPEASHVEPLDTVAWTSARNGYLAKLFEVHEVAHDLMSGAVTLSLREVDPEDYDWSPEFETSAPSAPVTPVQVPVLVVPGPSVAGVTVDDANGPRRPGIGVTWTAAVAAASRGIEWELRRVGGTEVLRGSVQQVDAGGLVITEGVLPGVAYELRLRLVSDLDTPWTAWIAVIAPDVRFGLSDMADDVAADLASLHDWIDGGVTDLPGELAARTAAIEALADEIAAETVARVTDAELSANRWREQRDTIRALVADVVELASASHSAREEIRQALTVQLGDLGAIFAQQIVVLADADQAAAIRLTDLEASSSDLSAQINQVEVARVAGDDALAALIAEISVGSAVQFDHAAIWYFDATVEGWTGSPDAPTTATAGWLRPGTDSSVISPDVAVAGGSYAQVRARLRRGGAPVWQGWLWWAGPGQGWDAARRITVAEPVWDDGIAILTANPDWTGEIERIRFDLTDGSDGTDYVEFDWIAIGRPAPGASSADLLTEQQARIDGDSALASDLTALGARVDDAETGLQGNADAIAALDVRVEATEDGLTVQGEAITALDGQITDPATGLAALAEAIDQITIDAGIQGDGQFAQAQTLRALQAAIRGVAAEGIEAAARDQTRQQAVRDYVAEAAQNLNARVDLTDGEVAIIAEAVTLLQAAIPGLASAEALAALTATVTEQGDSLESQASSIVSLTTGLGEAQSAADAAGALAATKADSSALTALDTRVTSAEGTITAQASNLVKLNAATGDRLNVIPGNQLDTAALWSMGAGWVLQTPSTITGARSLGRLRYLIQPGEGFGFLAESEIFAAVPSSRYRASFQARGTGVGSWTVRGRVAFYSESGAFISHALVALQSGSGTGLVTTDPVEFDAPSTARSMRMQFAVDRFAGAVGVDVTGPQIERVGAALAATRASLTALDEVISAPGTGLAARTTALETSLDDAEGDLAAQASALDTLTTRVTDTEGDVAAQAEALTELGVEVGGFSAEGKFRATVEATPAGALSRIGLKAAATDAEGDTRAAALFLEAIAGDLSRVLVDADRFGVVTGSSFGLVFEVSGGEVFIRNARIQNAAIDTLKIAGNAVTVPVYADFPGQIRPVAAPGAQVASAAIVREGFATRISFGCQLSGPNYAEVRFAVKRNGTTIRQVDAGSGPLGASQSVFFQFEDTNLGTGATTYRVDAIWLGGAQAFLTQRTISLQQTKR